MSFFGVGKDSSGNYYFNNSEQIPPNYRTRSDSYDSVKLSNQMIGMYALNASAFRPSPNENHFTNTLLFQPVNFGGNFGPNNFNGMNYTGYITNGQMNEVTAANAMCQMFQEILSGVFPTELGKVITIPVAVETVMAKKLAPALANFGCPNDYLTGNP